MYVWVESRRILALQFVRLIQPAVVVVLVVTLTRAVSEVVVREREGLRLRCASVGVFSEFSGLVEIFGWLGV